VGAIKHEVKRAIYQIYKEKERFPTLQEMCDALSFSADNTRKCMATLAESGHIESIGDWYKYPGEGDPPPLASLQIIPSYALPEEQEERANPLEKEVPEALKPVKEFVYEIEEEQYSSPEIKEKAKVFFNKIKNLKLEDFTKPKEEEKPKKRTGRPRGKKNGTQIDDFIKSRDRNGIETNVTLYGVPIYIIQIAMGIIGVGASIISIYYTAIWLFEFLPIPFALLLSSIMVGFSVFAFETVILFASGQVTRSRISKILISTGFVILWIVVSAFSIFSTVAGQYNRNVANKREQVRTGVDSGKASWVLLQERKTDLQKRIGEQRDRISTLNKLLSGMGDVKTRSENNQLWYETQFRLQEANKEITKSSDELEKIRDEEDRRIAHSKKTGEILNTSKVDLPDFYGWLAGIFNVSHDWVQFLMSLFPAVFVDIISPVGVALALFLRNKYKKI